MKLKDFLTISRANIQVSTIPTALFGIVLSKNSIFSLMSALYILLYLLIITFACNINCLYDYGVDLKYKKSMAYAVKNLGKHTIKKILFVEAAVILAVMLYFFISAKFLTSVFALLGLFLSYAYSATPLRLKSKGFFSFAPTFFGLYFISILGGYYLYSPPDFKITIFAFSYAMLNQGITFVNTCEDFEEDKEAGITTFAHFFGFKKTLLVSVLMTLTGGAGLFIYSKSFFFLLS